MMMVGAGDRIGDVEIEGMGVIGKFYSIDSSTLLR